METIYQVGKKIYEVIQRIKKAPEAIRELETQVLLVQSVLEALKRELEGREDTELIDWSTEPCLKMLARARGLAEEANEFLQKATGFLPSANTRRMEGLVFCCSIWTDRVSLVMDVDGTWCEASVKPGGSEVDGTGHPGSWALFLSDNRRHRLIIFMALNEPQSVSDLRVCRRNTCLRLMAKQ